MRIKKILALALASVLALSCAGCGKKDKEKDVPVGPDTRELTDVQYATSRISGTDALGRTVLPVDERQQKRDVGLFYFLWLGAHGNRVYDVSEMEENAPDEIFDPESEVSPVWQYHFWGKPLYGYYNNADPWVLTRHVELFTAAGIDFLLFDTSNGPTYDNVVIQLLEILERYRLQGFAVPKIAFMTNSGSKNTTRALYNRYYAPDAPNRYPELWYSPNGKPLILSDVRLYNASVEEEATLKNFFEMRTAQWPDALADDDAFPWMDWNYPQYNHNGTMSVSVAQHVSHKMSQKEGNWGRGFSYTDYVNNSDRIAEGSNFQGQWDTVFRANSNEYDFDDVETVFITGWNEWIALKKYESNDVFYVDQFNTEYSRDIEMDSGAYGDNYFMQMVQNIRNYAYTPGKHYDSVKTVFAAADANDAAWESVRAYPDFVGDAMARNYAGYDPRTTYTDDTNRNDIAEVKVATDDLHAYFRIECAAEIIGMRDGDAGSLCVWLDATRAQGFAYAVDCFRGKLQARKADGSYDDVSDVTAIKSGKVMTVAVPLSAIGVNASDPGFRFKVSDNVDASNVMNFYIQGDSAPIGRLDYTYGYIR